MSKDLYLAVSEELYKLTRNRKYLKEFIDKGQSGNVYTDNNNGSSQWSTLVQLTSAEGGEFNASVTEWGLEDARWQKALELAKENKLKTGSASNENSQKQCVMQITGLKQVDKSSNQLVDIPTSYVKLNLDSTGKLDNKANGFRRIFGLFTKGLHFAPSSFTLTQNKNEASYLSEDDTKTFISTFNDLARRNNRNKFNSNKSTNGDEYYADNNTRIVSSYVDSNAVKSTGSVNANFIVDTYLAKKNGLNLSSLWNDADAQIQAKAKEVDPSGIISSYLKKDSDITKSTIFSVINNIKQYTTDNEQISKTLKTIYSLTQNTQLDFDLQNFTDSSKFSSRLALSGILNNAKGGTGDAFAGYERIATTLTSYRFLNEKITNLMKEVKQLTLVNISRWLIFKTCGGVGSNEILEQIRKYCLGDISKDEFKAQSKFPATFDITPSNKDKCELRNLNECQTYWAVFTTGTENEESDLTLKMYIGNSSRAVAELNEVKKGTYEVKADSPIYLDGEGTHYYVSFAFNSNFKLKLNKDINELLPNGSPKEYFKQIDKTETYLMGTSGFELSLGQITVTLEKNENGLNKIKSIILKEVETQDTEVGEEEGKIKKKIIQNKKNIKKETKKETSKKEYIDVMVSAAGDKHAVKYKSSPNGKVYYKWNIHRPNGGKGITYVADVGQNVYGVISPAEAKILDPQLPSEEDIKKDTLLAAQAKGQDLI